MIGYFILLHRFPEQFKRMFHAIYAPGNSYVVHVDKGSGSEFAADIAAFLKPFQGVEIIESKNALWGGYSLVDAELRGMKQLLKMNRSWTHYINLSGQDFPLKSQAYIRAFLRANPDMTAKIEASIRQNSGLIAEQILAGKRDEDDGDTEGSEPSDD